MNGYSEISSQRYKITCPRQSDPESDPDPPLSLSDPDSDSGSDTGIKNKYTVNPKHKTNDS